VPIKTNTHTCGEDYVVIIIALETEKDLSVVQLKSGVHSVRILLLHIL